MSSELHGLEATLDRWEGEVAVLRTSDGQEIAWPAAELPDGIIEGAVVRLTVLPDSAASDDRRGLAKEVLNEIFGTPEDSSTE